MIRKWMKNRVRPLPKPLQQELQPGPLIHYKYVHSIVFLLILVTATPAFFAGGLSGLGTMLAIDGGLIGFSGHLVRLIPVLSGWKTENESQVEESLENFRAGMDHLDENEILQPDETGYEEIARLLVDRYDGDFENSAPIEVQSDSSGAVELNTNRIVTIDGDPVVDPQGPAGFELPFGKLRSDGERYAQNQIETVEKERQNRRSHFNILGASMLLVGTFTILLGTLLTGIDFIQTLIEGI